MAERYSLPSVGTDNPYPENTARHAAFEAGRASLAANAGSEPVAVVGINFALYWAGSGPIAPIVEKHGIKVGSPLFTHPSPPEGMAGWISVDERLPEPNVEVLCAGQGWGNAYVTACYYDDERREWYPVNTHWTDATGCAQYPTHWQPLPLPPAPSIEGESNG